ncbi:MAG: HD domain-containing protein [Treponema sp.]|nr:HD domain-containing protein [Treponema sp.]
MNCIKIHSDLRKVGKIFSEHGFKAYLVGGAVRDAIMKKEESDWDIATNATPQEVCSIFRKVIPTGIAHGTVTIHIFGREIETTTFRTESDYSDGRHPDKVAYAATIEEDLSRRDFTMNAIAASLETGELIDPYGGITDIQNKTIRTVGSALERFAEDGLRPVRAIRFAGQLGFQIEDETMKAISMPEILKKTKGISVERFRDEFCKMLKSEKPSVSLKLMEQTGIMEMFIPQFKICRGCIQNDGRGFHEFDVADHILYACDGSPRDNLIVRLAAFFHDIGKPECRSTESLEDGRTLIHFHGHETVSAKKAHEAMRQLKFSNEEIDRVTHLVKEHMFYYESCWSDAAVRRFIIRVGIDNFEDLVQLRLADIYGMHRIPLQEGSPSYLGLAELKGRIKKVIEEKQALGLKDMAVNGGDLIKLGIPAGKKMGAILKELFEAVTESPAMNKREPLLEVALNIYREKYSD